jgi:hypothetical protein
MILWPALQQALRDALARWPEIPEAIRRAGVAAIHVPQEAASSPANVSVRSHDLGSRIDDVCFAGGFCDVALDVLDRSVFPGG